MLRKMTGLGAVLGALLLISAIGFPRQSLTHAQNGVVFTNVGAPDINGFSSMTFTVNVENNNATLSAQSGSNLGHFTFANPIGILSCQPTPTDFSSNTVTLVTYQGSCLSTAGPPGTTPAGQAQWKCDSAGLVTFRIEQGANFDTRQISCNTPSTTTNTNLMSILASPNVVPCGGRTLISASVRDATGAVVTGAFFHFETDQGLLDPSGPNTAVLTVYPGMTSARVTATTLSLNSTVSASVLVQVFCPTPVVGGTGTPTIAGNLTLTAQPNAVDRCGGSVFIVVNAKDASGRPVPDGTTVQFIATGGTISSASGTTIGGAVTITFTADADQTNSVRVSAQTGAAFASVNIPITCNPGTGPSGSAIPAGTPRPATQSGTSSGSSSSTLPAPPIVGTVTFLAPRTGEAGVQAVSISPPNTGDAGLVAGLSGGAITTY